MSTAYDRREVRGQYGYEIGTAPFQGPSLVELPSPRRRTPIRIRRATTISRFGEDRESPHDPNFLHRIARRARPLPLCDSQDATLLVAAHPAGVHLTTTIVMPTSPRQASEPGTNGQKGRGSWVWRVLAVVGPVATIILYWYIAQSAIAPRTGYDENHLLQMARLISGDDNVTQLAGSGLLPGLGSRPGAHLVVHSRRRDGVRRRTHREQRDRRRDDRATGSARPPPKVDLAAEHYDLLDRDDSARADRLCLCPQRAVDRVLRRVGVLAASRWWQWPSMAARGGLVLSRRSAVAGHIPAHDRTGGDYGGRSGGSGSPWWRWQLGPARSRAALLRICGRRSLRSIRCGACVAQRLRQGRNSSEYARQLRRFDLSEGLPQPDLGAGRRYRGAVRGRERGRGRLDDTRTARASARYRYFHVRNDPVGRTGQCDLVDATGPSCCASSGGCGWTRGLFPVHRPGSGDRRTRRARSTGPRTSLERGRDRRRRLRSRGSRGRSGGRSERSALGLVLGVEPGVFFHGASPVPRCPDSFSR